VNVVILAGSVAADPVQRRMPSGDEVTEGRMAYCTSMGVTTKIKDRAPTMVNPRKRLMIGWRE